MKITKQMRDSWKTKTKKQLLKQIEWIDSQLEFLSKRADYMKRMKKSIEKVIESKK